MKKTLLTLISISLLFSCSNDKKKVEGLVFSNDFESSLGWAENNTITTGEGHSGKVVSKTTPESQYSYTFHRLLKDISPKRIKRAQFSAWVSLSSANSKGSLVLSIDSVGGEKSILWNGVDTKNFVTSPNKWTQIKGTVNFPANISPASELKFYFWNTGKDAILVDDVECTRPTIEVRLV